MNRGFRFHEHTADITIECWAQNLESAFEEASLAAFEVIMDTSTVTPSKSIDIECKGIDLQELLVEWVGRIIALVDIEYCFFSKFEVGKISKKTDGFELEGRVWGEAIDFDKHTTRTEVKAMTYADLKIEETPERTTIWFTLDL
ncbi:archease [Candidatus Thorarchaeota archaeon]|nr:MAG: archease [Candidatus Thorarchaeota archaeon]